MAILSIGSVSKSFGENTLFQNVSFSLEAKDKVGFIGSNVLVVTLSRKYLSCDITIIAPSKPAR